MSGHSKWHNIREKKSKVDAVKGKAFTKIAREIMMAARQGGGNPEANFRLRLALIKAKEVNMPKDNIERAIQKGSGQGSEEGYEEMLYEGYGPGGVAVLMEIATDNRNRTAGDLRSLFSKHGGNLGESGCVAWMFEKKGILYFDSETTNEDELLSAALEAGALDLKKDGETLEVYTLPSDFEKVKKELEGKKFIPSSYELTMVPQSSITLNRPL
ncbi:MAG: YebC/PmpR family DNA-binding transcriptional regulator, partial [Firmicutes bacterium]|nr:YebC/PmpR family DNA-binding transcriptional regulator [Bacillota bacterium]